MRSTLLLLLALGCDDGGPVDSSGPPDTDADTDTDVDADTDADTDTDEPPEPQEPVAKLRILHVAPGHDALDMFVNAGASPMLKALDPFTGTGWTERPIGTFDFQFTVAGGDPASPLYELQAYPLLESVNHTFIMHAALDGSLAVLPVIDDATGIAPTAQRIRWTHVAPDLGSFDVVELVSGAVFADDLAFGETMVADYKAGPMTIGIDLDGDGQVEHEFQGFDLSVSAGAGKMVDLQIVTELGVPFLIAYQPTGVVARRDVVGPGTPADTGPTDTAP